MSTQTVTSSFLTQVAIIVRIVLLISWNNSKAWLIRPTPSCLTEALTTGNEGQHHMILGQRCAAIQMGIRHAAWLIRPNFYFFARIVNLTSTSHMVDPPDPLVYLRRCQRDTMGGNIMVLGQKLINRSSGSGCQRGTKTCLSHCNIHTSPFLNALGRICSFLSLQKLHLLSIEHSTL
jgi:hypothetical protein